jgi:hypothetical protein
MTATTTDTAPSADPPSRLIDRASPPPGEPGPPSSGQPSSGQPSSVQLASPTVERAQGPVPSSAWFGPSLRAGERRELMAFLGSHNGVAVLQWPRDAEHLATLATAGIPRLLLAHPSPSAPPADGALQVSLAYPSDQDEVHRALVALCGQAARQRSASGAPVLDAENRLRAGQSTVELPPVTRPLVRLLVEHFPEPVDDEQLLALVVPGSSANRPTLEGQLAQLCHLVNQLGLEVVPKPGHTHALRWCGV